MLIIRGSSTDPRTRIVVMDQETLLDFVNQVPENLARSAAMIRKWAQHGLRDQGGAKPGEYTRCPGWTLVRVADNSPCGEFWI